MNLAGITRLDPKTYRRTPWKNGGGVTVDIADAYAAGRRARKLERHAVAAWAHPDRDAGAVLRPHPATIAS